MAESPFSVLDAPARPSPGADVVVITAHPQMEHSRINRRLMRAAKRLPATEDSPLIVVRDLYALYPDYLIDVAEEQAVLASAKLIVWQHPIYWYGPPPLMSLWFEKVLARGWAYGKGGDALRGKACLWVPTAGGDSDAYREGGMHGHSFDKFVPPVEQTARFCGMVWQPPLILHGSHHATDEQLHARGLEYRDRLSSFRPLAAGAGSISPGAFA